MTSFSPPPHKPGDVTTGPVDTPNAIAERAPMALRGMRDEIAGMKSRPRAERGQHLVLAFGVMQMMMDLDCIDEETVDRDLFAAGRACGLPDSEIETARSVAWEYRDVFRRIATEILERFVGEPED